MRKGLFKKLFVCMLPVVVATVLFPVNSGFETNATDFRELGYQDGLDWELWYSNGGNNDKGTGEMELTGNGGYIAEWDNVESYFARTGIKWEYEYDDADDTYKYYDWRDRGDIVINYDVDYRPDGGSTLGVYGCSNYYNYDFEFYIVENYYDFSTDGFEYVDAVEVDGVTYDFYKYVQQNIDGTTYRKYFNIRRDEDKCSSGAINVSKHLYEWLKRGLEVTSYIQETSLYVEGYNSSGYAEVKKNFITLGGVPVNEKVSVDYSVNSHSRGDINNDGRVDVFDVISMRKAIVESMTSQYNCAAADIDGNGKLAMNDIVILSRYVLGKMRELPDVVTTIPTTTVKTTKNPDVTTTVVSKPELPIEPDKDGVLIRESFENGMNYFIGGTNAQVVSDESFIGDNSLFVSVKDSSLSTVEIDISEIFVPGVEYEAKAVIKQKDKRKAYFDWRLYYTDSQGEEFDEHLTNKFVFWNVNGIENDVWGELITVNFDVDESWSDCKLVIICNSEYVDYYVDDIIISEFVSEDTTVVNPTDSYERNDKYQPIENGEFLTDYIDGYEYEYYLENYEGDSRMDYSNNDRGSANVYWGSVDNYRCTIRKRMPAYIESPTEIEKLNIDFYANLALFGECCIGVHGWTQDELAEYYIIEKYSIDSLFNKLEFVDIIDIGGVEYDVYKGMKTNQPSIEGTKTYPVYYSIRRDGRMNKRESIGQSARVDLKKHFYQWKKLGLVLGEKLYDVSLFVEAKNLSSGHGTLSIRDIYFSEFTSNPDADPEREYKSDPGYTPDENGYLINESFENGVGEIYSTSDAIGKLDSSASYSGENSFKLTNRQSTNSNIYIPLGTTNFEPGKKFTISTMVMQDEIDYNTVFFVIRYNLPNDIPCMFHNAEIEGIVVPKGEWVELSEQNFIVPEDAYDLSLEIIADNSKNSFYIDDLKVALIGV